MDAPSILDDESVPCDAGGAWAASCVSDMLARHGIPPRHQAATIAQICAISVSQARRKLRGAVWLFSEVLALCRHHGESLDAVFSAQPPEATARGAGALDAASLPARLLIDDQEVPCLLQAGALCAASASSGAPCAEAPLLATLRGEQWVVGSAARLDSAGLEGPRYRVDHLHVSPTDARPRARIAVLDDDLHAAQALSDWFNELGFHALAFTRTDALCDALPTGFQAFVVDLILDGGETSQAVVERIRREQPAAPIVLLTGQLREGNASESTLATLLRTQNVTFFEKPVRPAMITAAIQNGLDRLQAAA